ncbi:MAG: aryl-sulfate sulfotransferase [Bacteroidetes bacterium]|nr:aryl-sulfate sulfotransferase [Bacteroidota bacterium]
MKKSLLGLLVLLLFGQCKHSIQPATPMDGVLIYDTAHADPGLNILDQKERSLLLDMRGNVLREYPWGFIKVLSDGTMLGASDSMLAKFDVNGKVLWQVPISHVHHEITVDDGGAIYLFVSQMDKFKGINLRYDVILILSPEGKVIYRWSLLDHWNEYFSIISKSVMLKDLLIPFDSAQGIEEYISQAPERFFIKARNDQGSGEAYEWSHLNSMQVLPDNSLAGFNPAFRKGNLLISLNPYACYGILDTATRRFEWIGYLPDPTRLHTVTLTPQNTILIFQNSTDAEYWDEDKQGREAYLNPLHKVFAPRPFIKPVGRPWVSITEYEPRANKIVWEYTAEPKESMAAPFLGSAQRLPNGNTLICASTDQEGTKVMELDTNKKQVWLYLPTEKDWETHLPASFYRMTRIGQAISEKMKNQLTR